MRLAINPIPPINIKPPKNAYGNTPTIVRIINGIGKIDAKTLIRLANLKPFFENEANAPIQTTIKKITLIGAKLVVSPVGTLK